MCSLEISLNISDLLLLRSTIPQLSNSTCTAPIHMAALYVYGLPVVAAVVVVAVVVVVVVVVAETAAVVAVVVLADVSVGPLLAATGGVVVVAVVVPVGVSVGQPPAEAAAAVAVAVSVAAAVVGQIPAPCCLSER